MLKFVQSQVKLGDSGRLLLLNREGQRYIVLGYSNPANSGIHYTLDSRAGTLASEQRPCKSFSEGNNLGHFGTLQLCRVVRGELGLLHPLPYPAVTARSKSFSKEASMALFIVHDEQSSRFATQDGEAYVEYHIQQARVGGSQPLMNLYHTYVPPSKRGGGVAGQLCQAAFEYAKEKGFLVMPSCSYVSETYLPRHPEYADLVEGGERHRSGL